MRRRPRRASGAPAHKSGRTAGVVFGGIGSHDHEPTTSFVEDPIHEFIGNSVAVCCRRQPAVTARLNRRP